MYVDDLNLVKTLKELIRRTNYLKEKFKIKDLKKTQLCLDLQIDHFPNGFLVH